MENILASCVPSNPSNHPRPHNSPFPLQSDTSDEVALKSYIDLGNYNSYCNQINKTYKVPPLPPPTPTHSKLPHIILFGEKSLSAYSGACPNYTFLRQDLLWWPQETGLVSPLPLLSQSEHRGFLPHTGLLGSHGRRVRGREIIISAHPRHIQLSHAQYARAQFLPTRRNWRKICNHSH